MHDDTGSTPSAACCSFSRGGGLLCRAGGTNNAVHKASTEPTLAHHGIQRYVGCVPYLGRIFFTDSGPRRELGEERDGEKMDAEAVLE